MKINSSTAALFGMLILLIGRAEPLPAQKPEARQLPTAGNMWRVRCVDGIVIPHVPGSYGDIILRSKVCAGHGGVNTAWDEGLGPLLNMPPPFIYTGLIPEDGPPPKIPPKWANASCNVAACADSARNTLAVTYLDDRKSPGKELNCNDVGLLNPRGLRSVAVRRIPAKPGACAIGIR